MECLTINDNLKLLRQVSEDVDFEKDDINSYVELLREYCNTHDCFALALVQLGILKRIVYINSTDPTTTQKDENLILINPKIIDKKGKTEFYEACTSCLDNFALVERPYAIKLEYQDVRGENKIVEFKGFSSTVISHELDHLEGIFHMDRAKKLMQMSKSERVEFRKLNPYKVISKTCNFEYGELKD